MPYKITSKCSGKDTRCEDACPFDCIHIVAANGRKHLAIDEEECTNCGACALACRESAIVFDSAYMALKPQPMAPAAIKGIMTGSIGGWDGKEQSPKNKLDIPEGFVVLDRKVQSWASLMSQASN